MPHPNFDLVACIEDFLVAESNLLVIQSNAGKLIYEC